MKVISFTVFGNNPIYDIGLLKNLDLAKKIYQGWDCWVYCPKDYHLIPELEKRNCKVFTLGSLDKEILQTMWRFIPMFVSDLEIMIARDCDARLTQREFDCVKRFEESNYNFQILRDHDAHFSHSIMAGMFGCKPNKIKNYVHEYTMFIDNVQTNSEDFSNFTKYLYNGIGYDELFLAKYIYNDIKDTCMDCSDKFDIKIGELLDKWHFIGNKYDENDTPLFIRGF